MPQFKINAQHYCAKPQIKNTFRINGISTRHSRSIPTKLEEKCSSYNGDEECILCLVRGFEGEAALRRPGPRQDYNIKMEQHEVGWGSGWVYLTLLGQVA
jgi:hypothetical protein